MNHKFTADWMFLSDGKLYKDKVLIADGEGTILSVDGLQEHDPASVQTLRGTLCPGFVNAHCHLELSHMKGKVNSGSGLIPFISNVVKFRDTAAEAIAEAIRNADREMLDNGIVAVGDISNKTDTASVKTNSPIDYYTFVEMFDFLQPGMTNETISQYIPVFKGQSDAGNNKKSFVPHAPYTVSPALFEFINQQNLPGSTVSIHNQETPPENELFLTGTGKFIDFYKGFEMKMDHFQHTGTTSIHYAIQHLSSKTKVLFVHNTFTTSEEIQLAQDWNPSVYWASCPNANLYIENVLPDYSAFIQQNAKVAIGTDSLTSNWQLSVWEEVKTIKKYQSFLPLNTLMQWATINGAEALGYDDRIGSFTVGKKPGIICLDHLIHPEQDLSLVDPRRLI
ncbi:MAG: amidohydrolase family protein [Saprospiraceae bacterium]|jgi:cytosine/adenosine deaminase-related metal-dependent hydrolase|nr:amidohydrolase family protein [Saprospiraceae bacterium]